MMNRIYFTKVPNLKRNLLMLFILISCIPSFAGMNSSNTQQEIQIDNQHQLLIAPSGSGYIWYVNGTQVRKNQANTIIATESGRYTVEYMNASGIKETKTIQVAVKDGEIKKIFIIGDSTVSTYRESDYPQTGWGQVLQHYFQDSLIEVVNHAIGGRSSRSFHEEGRWTDVVNSLQSGDYVFIQFGHNDRDWTKEERYTDTAQYKDYLRIYVNETRAKNATPVLVSPMIMHAYNGSTLRNVFTEGENDYRGAMLEVANELNAHFVDLNMKSYDRVKEVGQTYATYFWFFGLIAGEYPNYPDGHSDGTHFQEMGALEMARLITEGIQELSADSAVDYLTSSLKPLYPVNITMSLPDAGEVTHSGQFPAGANVTIKTKLDKQYNFLRWEDDSSTLITDENLYQFIMTEKEHHFNALIGDCNGTLNGEAYIDDCKFCVKGETGLLPCNNIFDAEWACHFEGDPASVKVDGVTRPVINTNGNDPATFLYGVHAGEETTYDFALIYHTSASGINVDIHVNEESAHSEVPVPPLEEWGMLPFSQDLQAGDNLIEIVAHTGGNNISFDMLIAYSDSLSDGTCPVTAINQPILIPGKDIQLYPNPFTNNMTLSTESSIQYEIRTPAGILIDNGICRAECKIGSDLQQGIYLLHLQDAKNRYHRWIIKE